MHTANPRQHAHVFGQDRKRPGEARTLIVIAITSLMMAVEIASGVLFGSMALLADGLHMASHAVALGISAFAYVYTRRHARDERFSFGTGKVNALGGFAGSVLLAVFSLMMAWESVLRLLDPVDIAIDQAIVVAVLGLVVNGASVVILGHARDRDSHHHYHSDHNLRSAYLHVLADALTSLLAIFALLVAKYFGLIWMDPLMGIAGAILVARWSAGLLRTTGMVLLDAQGPHAIEEAIRNSIERRDENRVADLHLWSIGPDIYGAEITVVTHDVRSPDHYKQMIPEDIGVAHVNVEVHGSPELPACAG